MSLKWETNALLDCLISEIIETAILTILRVNLVRKVFFAFYLNYLSENVPRFPQCSITLILKLLLRERKR